MMKLFIAIACLFVFAQADKYGIFDLDNYAGGGEVRECHGVECPPGTVGCSKTTKTSSDTKTLLTTLQCEDAQGNVLNSATKTSPNKYAGTHISSFSFTGQYSYNGGQQINMKPTISKTHNFNKDYNNNYNFDAVETFD
ncbi:hypothetical protein RN001_014513 [Aquatica leii]|uniref:Uncharacterized protein n=1 Tax=Aquatica leii TaxID=1421715 RepID=A0AAN7NY49_9COLE|nr:hypothetical protein RN001_014513 [Aquatica leii]